MRKFYLLTVLTLLCPLLCGAQSLERSQAVAPGNDPANSGRIFLQRDAKKRSHRPLGVIAPVNSTAAISVNSVKEQAKAPAFAAGTRQGTLQGFLGYFSGAANNTTRGWYNITVPGATQVWKYEQIPPSCGFVRDGKIISWYHYSTTSGGLEGIGTRTYDLATGTVLSEQTFNVFDNLDKIVWGCAYDSDNDIAYLITSKSDNANAFQVTGYNPETREYTRLCDFHDFSFVAMAWSPADGNLYMLFPDGALIRLNKETGDLTLAFSTDHEVSDFDAAMVYSPKDHGMLFLAFNADDDSITEAGVINMENGQVTMLGEMAFEQQWNILYCPDPYSADNAPQQASLRSWDFTGAALSGNALFNMPSKDNLGNSLSSLFVEVTVDGATTPVYDKSATPGSYITVPLTLTEGEHKIRVRPYIYSGINKIFATALVLDKYAGNDVPSTPQNVTLTKNRVTWSAVTTGAHDGYVDAAAMRYNVYINGTKMNSAPVAGTALDINLPEGAGMYTAAVEATVNGKTSEQGASEVLIGDGPIYPPYYLGPAEGEKDMTAEMISLFTIVNKYNEDLREWRYDDQIYNRDESDDPSGGFYHLYPKESKPSDAWLFLPATMFDDTEAMYSFTFEASASNHYFAKEETFEVALSDEPTAASPKTVIKSATKIQKRWEFTPIEVLFQVPEKGAKYIGIHCISEADTYRLYARRFRVKKTSSTATAPGKVQNITVAADPEGYLRAEVGFDLPTTDMKGDALAASSAITATVATSAGEVSVNGKPGQHVSATVACVQGDNNFVVTAAIGNNKGEAATANAFVGVDIPVAPLVNPVISADNMAMTLEWEQSKVGQNNGPVLPAECEYEILRRNGSSWVHYADVGHDTSFTFRHSGSGQQIEEFAVQARNAAGEAATMATAGDVLGTPYGLPMKETFDYEGEDVKLKYTPYYIRNLSELSPSWAFVNPTDYEQYGATANESGIALSSYYMGAGEIQFPKFSTVGLNNVKLTLNMHFGSVMPAEVAILGCTEDISDYVLASFSPNDGNGWEERVVSLPAAMQNKPWVAFKIRINVTNYSTYFLLDRFEVSNFPGNDVAVSDLRGDLYGNVGEKLDLLATVRNMGSESIGIPAATYEVLKGSEVIASGTPEVSGTTLRPGNETDYTFSLVPQASWLGNARVRLSIESNDDVTDNNSAETRLRIFSHNIPVPQNLSGKVNEETAKPDLSWDDPMTVFGAEEVEAYTLRSSMAGFKNLDRDELTPYGLNGLNYPNKYAAKAFYAIPIALIAQSIPPLAGDCGANVLMVCASGAGETDDWLISPQVKGESEVRFKTACLSAADGEEYLPEKLEIWYSTTTDAPEAFTKLDEAVNSLVEWKNFSFTLPADAKYFALRYAMPQKGFCLLVDNITYSPADFGGTILGYNVYNSNAQTPYAVAGSPWTDESYDGERPTAYEVRTRVNLGGSELESDPSNPVLITPNSIGSIGRHESAVTSGRGFVELKGLEGNRVRVANAAGITVADREITAPTERISVAPGVYLVTAGRRTYKVIVK